MVNVACFAVGFQIDVVFDGFGDGWAGGGCAWFCRLMHHRERPVWPQPLDHFSELRRVPALIKGQRSSPAVQLVAHSKSDSAVLGRVLVDCPHGDQVRAHGGVNGSYWGKDAGQGFCIRTTGSV